MLVPTILLQVTFTLVLAARAFSTGFAFSELEYVRLTLSNPRSFACDRINTSFVNQVRSLGVQPDQYVD